MISLLRFVNGMYIVANMMNAIRDDICKHAGVCSTTIIMTNP